MKVLFILALLAASSVVDSFEFELKDWDCAKQCRNKKVDVVFVVDGSNSSRFYRSKRKIFNILKPFKTHRFVHRMKLHFIQFGGNSSDKTVDRLEHRAFNICATANKHRPNKYGDECDSLEEFKAKVLKIEKLKGEAKWSMVYAFNKAASLQLRPDSTKVLVTITGDESYDAETIKSYKLRDGWKRFDFTYQLFIGKQLPATCGDNCFYANEGEELYRAAATMSKDVCCSYTEPKCLKKCGSKPLDLVFMLLGDQTHERYMSNLFTVVEKSWQQLKIDESYHKVHVEVHKVDPGSNITDHMRSRVADGVMSFKLVSDVCTKMQQQPHDCENLENVKNKLRSLYSPLNVTELKPAIDFASNATNFQFRENSHKVLVLVFDGVPRDFDYKMYSEGQLSRDVEGLNAVFDYKQAWFMNMESRDTHIAGFECSRFNFHTSFGGFSFQTSMHKLRSVIGCPIVENHEECTGRAGCSPENLPVFRSGSVSNELTPWYEVGSKAYIKCYPQARSYYQDYSVCQSDGTFKPKSLKCQYEMP